MVEDFYIKKDDTLPNYTTIVRDQDGAMDLTGATVLFTMQDLATETNKVSAQAASLITGVKGGIEYLWQVGDTDTAGEYGVEFEITTAGGVFTVPKGFTAKVIVEDTYV